MRRSLSSRLALLRVLLASVLLFAASSPLAGAQATSSVTVGSSTIGYTSDWQAEVSDAEGVLLANDALGISFTYYERPDASSLDIESRDLVGIEILSQLNYLRDSGDLDDFGKKGDGTLPDGTFWDLHMVVVSGTEFNLLVTGHTGIVPGADVVTVLIAPAGIFLVGVVAAGNEITINGQPPPHAGIAMEDVFNAIGVSAEGDDAGSTPVAPVATDMVPPAAAPVQISPYVTVSNQSLAWAEPWTFDGTRSTRTGTNDMALLLSGTSTVVVATGAWTPDDARTAALTTLGGDPAAVTALDQGASYWFQLIPINGVPHGVFALAQTSPDGATLTMTMFVSPVPDFAAGLGQAQGTVTLDGAPVFDGVDGAGLQAQLEANAPAPAASATDVPAATFVPIGSWTDESFGYTVEWAAGWSSAGERNTNTFMLAPDARNAIVHMTAIPRDRSTPETWAALFEDRFPEIVPGIALLHPVVGENNTIGAGVVGDEMMVEEVLFLDDGETVVHVTLGFPVSELGTVVDSYRASVRIDGHAPLEGWEAIAAELAATTAVTAPAPTAPVAEPTQTAANVPYADAGMVAENQYVSPQFGTQVQWTDDWTLDTLFNPPVSTDPNLEWEEVHITWRETDAIWMVVYSTPTYGLSMHEIIDYWSSDRTVLSVYGEQAEVIDAASTPERGAILTRVRGFVPTYYYEEYHLSPDGSTLVIVEFGSIGTSEMEDGLLAAQSDVTVNDEPVLTFHTIEEILAFFGQ